MISKKKIIFLTIIVLLVTGWHLGDARSGTKAIKRKASEQASIYLKSRYPEMKYKIGEVTFSTPNMLITDVGVETIHEDIPLVFTVTVTNKGEVTDNFQESIRSNNLKQKIEPLVKEMILNNSLNITTVKSGTEYSSYIHISWEETLTTDEFIDKCLLVKNALVKSAGPFDLITFRVKSEMDHYVLKLNKKQLDFTKEEIYRESLIQK